jgi:hypothetical protein
VRRLLVLAAALLCNCDSENVIIVGPRLSLQKLLPQEGCWATMSKEAPAVPLPGTLCGTTAAPRIVASTDALRLIIDYGDVTFSTGTVVPPPTVTVLLDGVEATQPGVTLGPVERLGTRAFFIATLVAPARAVSSLRLAVKVADGFATAMPDTFTVDAPVVTLSVLECVGQVACERVSGIGSVLVDVSVAGDTPQAVVISGELDGVGYAETTMAMAATVLALDGGPRQVTARVPVPVPVAVTGTRWRLTARAGTTLSAQTPEITLVAPSVGIFVEQCAGRGASCELYAGASTVSAVVVLSGETARGVQVASVLEGIELSTQMVRAENALALDGGVRAVSGRTSVAVPLGPDGARWVLTARAGTSQMSTPEMTLRAPAPRLAIQQCDGGAPCRLVSGVGSAIVDVSVPGEVAADVTVLSTVDGVLSPSAQMVRAERSAFTPDGGRQLVTTIFLPVPEARAGADWVLTARSRGFESSAPPIVLDAPTLDVKTSCNPCTAGSMTAVTVSAPAQIRTLRATVSSLLDSVPRSDFFIDLDTIDSTAGRISGRLVLPVPALQPDAGTVTWQLDARLGNVRSPSFFTTVRP